MFSAVERLVTTGKPAQGILTAGQLGHTTAHGDNPLWHNPGLFNQATKLKRQLIGVTGVGFVQQDDKFFKREDDIYR